MSDELDYQICPSCKGEFTLSVARCVECDVDLVAPPVDEDGFPSADELVCVRVAPLPWIEALSDGLEQREIPHRVEPVSPDEVPEGHEVTSFGPVELFGLYVDDGGLDAARELDDAIVAQVRPEQHAEELPADEVETCPACGEALSADATDCPECGLSFGS